MFFVSYDQFIFVDFRLHTNVWTMSVTFIEMKLIMFKCSFLRVKLTGKLFEMEVIDNRQFSDDRHCTRTSFVS